MIEVEDSNLLMEVQVICFVVVEAVKSLVLLTEPECDRLSEVSLPLPN